MSEPGSAIVVGGGLIGCSTAYYLSEHGWDVTLLERGRIGSGASWGNCGYVCPSHVMPLAVPGAIGKTLRTMLKPDSPVAVRWRADRRLAAWLMRFATRCRKEPMMRSAQGRHALLSSSMSLYRGLMADAGLDCSWRDEGLLFVYRSEEEFNGFASTAEVLRKEFGVAVDPLPGSEVTRFEPTLKPDTAGGWLFPNDAHVRPDRLLASLRKLLDERGVQIREGVAVESLDVSGGRLRRIETSSGWESADAVVIAAGAETPAFAKPLRCHIPIQPGKGYSVTAPMPSRAPRVPMIFEEHHVAVTPMDGELRIGSTMEFAGYDRSINRKRLGMLMRSAEQHLIEAPTGADSKPWVGWRPMVYDGMPCIDRAPAVENAFVVAGNGMIGLATAPATGKLAAEIVSGSTPHLDPRPYSLARFN